MDAFTTTAESVIRHIVSEGFARGKTDREYHVPPVKPFTVTSFKFDEKFWGGDRETIRCTVTGRDGNGQEVTFVAWSTYLETLSNMSDAELTGVVIKK